MRTNCRSVGTYSRLTTCSNGWAHMTNGFAATGGCGVNTKAGMDGDRTSLTDVFGGVTTTTAYYSTTMPTS